MHRSFSVQTHRHTHAELQGALDQTRQPAHTQAQSKKKKKIHKREDNTCTSGSEMRADEINPARMKGGEHPCDAGITHGEKLQKKKEKKNHLYLHKLTFVAVFQALRETQSLLGDGERILFR